RYTGQVHLHQRLLHGRLAALVAFDDLALEGGSPQLGDLQLDLAGLGLELAAVGAGAVVHPVGGALVLASTAQGVGLGIEQFVEGLLDGVTDNAIDVALELGLVDLEELHGITGNISYTTHGSPLGYGLG